MSYVPVRKRRFGSYLHEHPGQEFLFGLVFYYALPIFALYVAIQLACLGLDVLGGHWHGWLAHVTYWPSKSGADAGCHSQFPC